MARTILCFFVFLLCLVGAVTARKPNVPAVFVFGDSIVDGGNNVFVDPNCTTDTLPYGIDFPTGPTGRFTNGMNPADILSQRLKLTRFLPAFKDPKTTGCMIMHGVNYASGGSGILDYPGSLFISLNQQIEYFQNTTICCLKTQFNNTEKFSRHLAKSIFVFNSGGNDCAQECSRPVRQENCASDQFLDSLLANFTHQLKVVHNLGARKFVLFGVQANGCNPQFNATLSPTEKCREDVNGAALRYNIRLNSSIDGLKKSLPGSNFVFINTYGIVRNAYDNPESYGFKVVNQSCCTTTTGPRGGACVEGCALCKDRNSYMYFDGAHFTQAFYKHLVERAYTSELPTEVYPFNVKYLAGLP